MRTELLTTKIAAVWGFLVVGTIISWQVGTHGGNAETSASIVMGIAFVKVWMVGRNFMELDDAPDFLRRAFDGYVVVVATAIIAMYLVL